MMSEEDLKLSPEMFCNMKLDLFRYIICIMSKFSVRWLFREKDFDRWTERVKELIDKHIERLTVTKTSPDGGKVNVLLAENPLN